MLYDAFGLCGSMVVGLGNSLGWTKKNVKGFYRNKMRKTTYIEVNVLEAGPDTVAGLNFELWEAISLRD